MLCRVVNQLSIRTFKTTDRGPSPARGIIGRVPHAPAGDFFVLTNDTTPPEDLAGAAASSPGCSRAGNGAGAFGSWTGEVDGLTFTGGDRMAPSVIYSNPVKSRRPGARRGRWDSTTTGYDAPGAAVESPSLRSLTLFHGQARLNRPARASTFHRGAGADMPGGRFFRSSFRSSFERSARHPPDGNARRVISALPTPSGGKTRGSLA